MVRALSVALLLFLVAFLPLPSLAESGSVACYYATDGTVGALTIVNAAGLPYSAIGVGGSVVSSGVVTSSFFVTPVVGAASAQIAVRVGGELFLSGDRNGIWE